MRDVDRAVRRPHMEDKAALPRYLVGARVGGVLRHHLRHPLALGEGESGSEAEPPAGVDDHLPGRVEAFLRAVGWAEVEAYLGAVAHQLQPLSVDGDEVVLAGGDLVVRLVAVGRAGLDAEADVQGTGHGVAVEQIGLVHGLEVAHPLLQQRCGAQAGGERLVRGVKLLVEALEGAVHGQFRAAEAEVHVIAIRQRFVDLLLQQVERGDECLLAELAPLLHDAGGDVADVERALHHDTSLVALLAGQVALVDTDAQLAIGLGQVRLGYFLIHVVLSL